MFWNVAKGSRAIFCQFHEGCNYILKTTFTIIYEHMKICHQYKFILILLKKWISIFSVFPGVNSDYLQ